ncbi:MAG: Cell envelope-related transcriptional attenuator [Candidatus Peregrinibacteria bacterium GW2011_GWA2_43_8]|nr:MAG: Cell envelope-related transcriptional attenuator [Candidatus Peregrinibacteria bacterium GW2011_GWA2_43_8]
MHDDQLYAEYDSAAEWHFKLQSIAVVSLITAIASVFAAFLYVFSVFSTDLDKKSMQVDSLVTEVGELKDENLTLYQELEEVADMGEANLFRYEKVVSVPVVTVSSEETFDILIMGTHGTLTDTIMLASINPDLKTISLISIPRDLSVNGRKINEHYNLYGSDYMKEAAYEITGIMPEKYVVIDMQAFIDIVDAVGGVDVYVDKAIYDTLYPNGKGGYSTFYIEAGEQHLDGATALKYARSRESTSDFDRAERQQEVVLALKDKVVSSGLVGDGSAILDILSSVLENVDTDISFIDTITYYASYGNYTVETGNVLTTSNYLYSTYNMYGQYILLPDVGDYGEVWGRDYRIIVSQFPYFLFSPCTIFINFSLRRIVIGPFSNFILDLLMAQIGLISAAVPVKKASSAFLSSVGVIFPSATL